MHYYRYITTEHARSDFDGEMTAFYAVDDAGQIVSSIELYPDGLCLAYDLKHPADNYGMLPDEEMDAALAGKVGRLEEIDAEAYSAQASDIEAANR